MKLLYSVIWVAGAIALSNSRLIQNPPAFEVAKGQQPSQLQQSDAATFSSHLPDENNFQASGGATVGSFGGMARVFVMIAMFLGFLYTGILLGGGEGAIRPPSVRSLQIPKMQEPMEPEVIPTVSTESHQKPSRQAAKKARRDARRAKEETKEEASAPATVPAAPVTVTAPAAVAVEEVVPESPVGPARAAERPQKKKKEKKQQPPVVQAVEETIVAAPVEEVLILVETPLCLKEEELAKEEQEAIAQEVQQSMEPLVLVEREALEEEGLLDTPSAQQEYVEDLLVFAMAEEALNRQAEELLKDLHEPVEQADDGWLKRPPLPFEPTSVTIKRARRLMDLQSLLRPSAQQRDLDLGAFVVDPSVRPAFPKLTMPPFLPEETHSLDLASQEIPTAIEPMRDKMVSPPPVAQESHPGHEDESASWSFNSHKKSAWTRRQNRTAQWPEVPLSEFMCYGWSPIRTPCKFASACKKPGCQFTHPTAMPPAWNPQTAQGLLPVV